MTRWLAMIAIILSLSLLGCQPVDSAPPTITALSSEVAVAPVTEATPELQNTRAPAPTAFFGRSVTTSTQAATLVFIHADQNHSLVNIYLDDQLAAPNIAYGQMTRDLPILPGDYTVSFAAPDGAQESDRTSTLTISAGAALTVILTQGETSDSWIVVERPLGPLNGGTTRLTLVNATHETLTPTQQDGVEIFPELAAGSISEPALLQSGESDLIFSAGEIRVEGLQILRDRFDSVFILTGTPDESRLIRQETPVSGIVALRFIHLAPEAGELDIYIDDMLYVDNLEPLAATEIERFPANAVAVSVYEAGADRSISQPLVDSFRVNVRPDSQTSVLIMGDETQLQLSAIEEDISALAPGQTRIIFANALPAANLVQVRATFDGSPNIQPLGFGRASTPVILPSGEVQFIWNDMGTPSQGIFELSGLQQLPEGQTLIYALTGNQEESPAIYTTVVALDPSIITNFETNPTLLTRLRPVNVARLAQPVEFSIDGIVVIPQFEVATGGRLLEVPGPSAQITARLADGSVLIDRRITVPTGDHSLILYGDPIDGINLLLIDDSQIEFNPGTAFARLINLSSPPADYDLALGIFDDAAATVVAATPERPEDRPLIPSNVYTVANRVPFQTASRQTPVPIDTRDIYITDNQQRLVGYLPSVEFRAGTHTDILTIEMYTESGVTSWVWPVLYPSP
jgi:hypothetical protein